MLFDLAPVAAQPASDGAFESEQLPCSIEMDTAAVSSTEQFQLFRSWFAGLADVEPTLLAPAPFLARQMAWSFGRSTLIHLSTTEVSFAWRSLRNPTMDDWCVHLTLPQMQHRGGMRSDALSLRSLADPFAGRSERSDHLALFVPRNLPMIRPDRAGLRDEARQFLMEYLTLLFRSLPGLRRTDVGHIGVATTSLLAACLAPSRDRTAEAQRPIEAAIMSRASRIIGEHLASPALTPSLICREIGVSRSRLYRIFEPIGGVSTHIRRERLRRTRDALENSSDRRPISIIAEQWGFEDPSAYSRMFRKEFGVSPSEARAGGLRGVVPARSTDASTLRDLLLSNY